MITKLELNKDNTNRHTKMDREKPKRPQPYTNNSGNKDLLRVGEIVFPMVEYIYWLSNIK